MTVQQVGGKHYEAEYQHWDWVVDTQMGYLEGCASKYVSRWRKKNGLEDLKKARTYVQKITEVHKEKGYQNPSIGDFRETKNVEWITLTQKFNRIAGLDHMESEFNMLMVAWFDEDDLRAAIASLDILEERYSAAQAGRYPTPWPRKGSPLRSAEVRSGGSGGGGLHGMANPFGYDGDD